MNRNLLFLFLAALSPGAAAQAGLRVEVELSRGKEGGMVRLALCRGEEAYTTVKGCHDLSVPAGSTQAILEFEDLQPGEYAIKGFHDINSNGEMDFNLVGIPKEPYGFSNDARATFAPPPFRDARFTVQPGRNVTRMKM